MGSAGPHLFDAGIGIDSEIGKVVLAYEVASEYASDWLDQAASPSTFSTWLALGVSVS